MANQKINLRLVELEDYISPSVKEFDNQGWIKLGDDNDFFDYLIELYRNSPTNNAAIKGASTIMYGDGIEAVHSDRNLAGYVNLRKVFSASCIREICFDFKLFGMAAMEVIYAKDGSKVAKVYHMPMNYLRAGMCNDDGEIEEWYYSTEWEKYQEVDFEAVAIPSFGFSQGRKEREVLVIKPYNVGNYYYSYPNYMGCLQWADVETEISNYHLSNLKNGMWPGMLINFNNGVPDEDDQIDIEKQIRKKFGRTSKAGRFILAFNRTKDNAATIEPVQLSDAAEQFKMVSDEAQQKILVAHRITSGMLMGIKDNTGLGNNAEELQTAHALYVNTVIRPDQDIIIDAVNQILAANGHNLDLYFKPLTPLEFKDYAIPLDEETREKETGVTMSAEQVDLADDVAEDWLNFLQDKGEKVNADEWELAYEEEVTDPALEGEKINLFKRFANPEDGSSAGDSGLYKIRYRYSQNLSANSRIFCRNMVANSKSGVVYRREDIDLMTQAKVNIDLSPADCKRCGYDIWLHKGGARCHHRWVRQVYFRKRTGGKFQKPSQTSAMENDKRVSVDSAERAGVPTKKLEPKDWKKAETRPIDTPTKGYKNPKYAK